jgi:hypothetical protein
MPKKIKRGKLPQVGTVFEKSFRGQTTRAKVVSIDKSKGRVELEVNGKQYQSPSAAARALTGHETNGWVFWGIDKKIGL